MSKQDYRSADMSGIPVSCPPFSRHPRLPHSCLPPGPRLSCPQPPPLPTRGLTNPRACPHTVTQPPLNQNSGLFTGFWSVPFPQRQNDAVSLAKQYIAEPPVVGIIPEGPRPPVRPKSDSLVGLGPRTPRSGMVLRLSPWYHSIAVGEEYLIQSYTENSENLPGDLPRLITLLWDWRRRVAIPVHDVLRQRSESPEEADATLVRIAYLRQHRPPFEVPLADGLSFDVFLYRTRGEIS